MIATKFGIDHRFRLLELFGNGEPIAIFKNLLLN